MKLFKIFFSVIEPSALFSMKILDLGNFFSLDSFFKISKLIGLASNEIISLTLKLLKKDLLTHLYAHQYQKLNLNRYP